MVPTPTPNVVILLLWSEDAIVFRHKKLEFMLAMHGFRLFEAPLKIRSFLKGNFDVVRRSDSEVHDNLLALIDAITQRTVARILILNRASTSIVPGPDCCAHFAPPFGVATIANEQNLLLCDVARKRRDVSIVDVDAIVAELGAKEVLPGLVHQSGTLQNQVRREIVRPVHAREET